jgi:hypothetical protein
VIGIISRTRRAIKYRKGIQGELNQISHKNPKEKL